MIKKLRIKLILLLTLILSLVLTGVLLAVNISNYHAVTDVSYGRLNRIMASLSAPTSYFGSYFGNYFGSTDKYYYYDERGYEDNDIYIAFVGTDGNITNIAAQDDDGYSYEQISALTRQVLSETFKRGRIKDLIFIVKDFEQFLTIYHNFELF